MNPPARADGSHDRNAMSERIREFSARLDSGAHGGRRPRDGSPRTVTTSSRRPPGAPSSRIALDVVREPMFLLLVACGTIYFVLGEVQEGFMLLSFVFVIMAITFYQERKTERALEALKNLSSPRALVIRDGVGEAHRGARGRPRRRRSFSPRGTACPPTESFSGTSNLSTDESLLTGESLAVTKSVWDGAAEMGRPGGDGLPFVYSGTMVVRGQGIAEVKATGVRSEIGKIGKALQAVKPEETLLQKETGRLVREFRARRARSSAPSSSSPTGSRGATGSTDFSPGSRSPWRYCRRSSPSCSRSFSRSAPGTSRRSAFSRGTCPRSRRSAPRPFSASTRRGRSR